MVKCRIQTMITHGLFLQQRLLTLYHILPIVSVVWNPPFKSLDYAFLDFVLPSGCTLEPAFDED